jgi:hypothetical protein
LSRSLCYLGFNQAMSDLTTLLNQFAPILKGVAVVGIVTGVSKGFKWVDGGMSKEGRHRLGQWLKDIPGIEQIDAWASVFPNLIDRVFGPRAFSWRFFNVSFFFSLIAVFITSLISIAHYGLFEFDPLSRRVSDGTFGTFAFISVMALLLNCIPDYLSVVISRFIVRTMAKRPTALNTTLLLLLDTFLTVIIAVLSLAIFLAVSGMKGHVFTFKAMLHHPIEIAWIYLQMAGWAISVYPVMRVFLLASLFTSVWVWLYVLASVSIRILHKIRFVWVKIVPFLDVEKKPMTAVGRVAGLIAGLGYLMGLAGAWLYQHL